MQRHADIHQQQKSCVIIHSYIVMYVQLYRYNYTYFIICLCLIMEYDKELKVKEIPPHISKWMNFRSVILSV